MKRLIQSGAARIGVLIQDICANIDFEMVSLLSEILCVEPVD